MTRRAITGPKPVGGGLGPVWRAIAHAQTTLLGRVIIGPAFLIGRFVSDLGATHGATSAARAAILARHLFLCAPVLIWVIGICQMPLWIYVACFVYPGASLAMVRSFAEHRAMPEAERRTAIVENALILGPLFLFNNLHAAHHLRHRLPWYQLPKFYRLNRAALIERNGGLVYHGYFDVARRYLLRPHDSPIHPGWDQPGGVSGATPIAVLPMYDFPWTAAANDALWAAISTRLAEAGVQAPTRLTRGGDLAALWRHPGLIFGQTCGYPYVTGLKDTVTLIATPEYWFPGCEGASHRSFIIRRASDPRRELGEFRGATAALNAHDSNTGMNLFRAAIAPIAGGAPFFSAIVVTGSHEASVAAVAEGRADLASIDCVSFALLGRGRPELVERVAIVAESPLSPCLPFIASARLRRSTIDGGARGAVCRAG